MEYKNTFTSAEVEELHKWFLEHEYEDNIDLGQGIRIVDTKLFVENSFNVLTKKNNSATFSGIFYKLQILRECLIEQGKAKKRG